MTWENVTSALGNFGDIMSESLNLITSNPALMVCLAAGLIPLGFRIFKKAKRAVK